MPQNNLVFRSNDKNQPPEVIAFISLVEILLFCFVQEVFSMLFPKQNITADTFPRVLF